MNGTAARCGAAVGQHVVDPVLAGLHAGHVVRQRHLVLIARLMRAGESQQRQQLLAIGVVLGHAFLDDLAEFLPELRVLVRIVLRELADHVQRPLGERALHGLDVRILLQQLARDVQRQVAGIQDALDEAQIERKELLSVIHDENALHMQLQAAGGVALPQVKGRACRDVQQARVFALALDPVVAPGQGRFRGHG